VQGVATVEKAHDRRAEPFSVEVDGLAGEMLQAEQLAPSLVVIPVPQQVPDAAEPVAHLVETGVMDRLQGVNALQGLLSVAHAHGDVPPVEDVRDVAACDPA
jgi:hypothetical protein